MTTGAFGFYGNVPAAGEALVAWQPDYPPTMASLP
jgi:hypothetical protein